MKLLQLTGIYFASLRDLDLFQGTVLTRQFQAINVEKVTHVWVGQDELAKGVIEGVAVHALSGRKNQVGR